MKNLYDDEFLEYAKEGQEIGKAKNLARFNKNCNLIAEEIKNLLNNKYTNKSYGAKTKQKIHDDIDKIAKKYDTKINCYLTNEYYNFIKFNYIYNTFSKSILFDFLDKNTNKIKFIEDFKKIEEPDTLQALEQLKENYKTITALYKFI